MARIEYVCCTTREFLIACTASKWTGLPGRCRWCDAELTGQRSRWCSHECNLTFGANHYWTQASSRRHRTDGMCVDCSVPMMEAYERAVELGLGELDASKSFRHLEVHHLTPVLGKHAQNGCHHHQDGLVTVCRYHHNLRHRQLRDGTARDRLPQLRLDVKTPYKRTKADEALARVAEAFGGA